MRQKKGGCPKCNHELFWEIRRGRHKCRQCRHEYRSSWGKVCLPHQSWLKLVVCFLEGKTCEQICQTIRASKYKVLKATNEIRMVMQKAVLNKSVGFEDYLPELRFWEVGLGNNYDLENVAYIVSESSKEGRRMALLTKTQKKVLFRAMHGDKTHYLASHITIAKHGNRLLDLVYESCSVANDEIGKDELIINKYFGNSSLVPMIRKYILMRKGVNRRNLQLHCAEIVWRHRYRALTRNRKIELIKEAVTSACR